MQRAVPPCLHGNNIERSQCQLHLINEPSLEDDRCHSNWLWVTAGRGEGAERGDHHRDIMSHHYGFIEKALLFMILVCLSVFVRTHRHVYLCAFVCIGVRTGVCVCVC